MSKERSQFFFCVRSPFKRREGEDELNKGELVRIFVTGVANMFIVHIHLQRESRVAGGGEGA